MKRSKAYRAADEQINGAQLYTPEEALALVKGNASAKFDETVEVAMRLGVDPRKADQMVRGTVNLPHGTGKTARVLVFATGERAQQAADAGAGWENEFDTATTLDDYWTSANVQEVLPGLLTPLSITMFADAALVAYNEGYRRLKMLRKDENPNFVGMFYNRAFLNITATRMIADRALGSSGDAIEHRFLGGEYRGKPKMAHSRELWGFRLRSAGRRGSGCSRPPTGSRPHSSPAPAWR